MTREYTQYFKKIPNTRKIPDIRKNTQCYKKIPNTRKIPDIPKIPDSRQPARYPDKYQILQKNTQYLHKFPIGLSGKISDTRKNTRQPKKYPLSQEIPDTRKNT